MLISFGKSLVFKISVFSCRVTPTTPPQHMHHWSSRSTYPPFDSTSTFTIITLLSSLTLLQLPPINTSYSLSLPLSSYPEGLVGHFPGISFDPHLNPSSKISADTELLGNRKLIPSLWSRLPKFNTRVHNHFSSMSPFDSCFNQMGP